MMLVPAILALAVGLLLGFSVLVTNGMVDMSGRGTYVSYNPMWIMLVIASVCIGCWYVGFP